MSVRAAAQNAPRASARRSSSAPGDHAGRPFGIYIHVPFCATRCGYCDSTPTHPPRPAVRTRRLAAGPTHRAGAAAACLAELLRKSTPCSSAVAALGAGWRRPSRGVDVLARHFTLAATPSDDGGESGVASPGFFEELRSAGSPGCRSACSRWRRMCWAVLDSVHSADGALDADAKHARRASATSTSTSSTATPGETDDDLRRSVDARSTRASTTSPAMRW